MIQTKNALLLWLIFSLLTSCTRTVYYLDETIFGTEVISLDQKHNSFQFSRQTRSRTYSNSGTFMKSGKTITFFFADSILDSRYLPHYTEDNIDYEVVELEDDRMMVQPMDFNSTNPIQLQSVILYNQDLQPETSYETDLNGFMELDERFLGKKVIMYVAYWNPIILDIPTKKGFVIRPSMKLVGEFDMTNQNGDVITIDAMTFNYQSSSKNKEWERISDSEWNKEFIQVERAETEKR